MNGPLAVFLAALLALAAVPAGVGAPAIAPDSSGESTDGGALNSTTTTPVRANPDWANYLATEGSTQQTGFQSVTVDVGGSLASDSAGIDARYTADRVSASVEDAESVPGRTAAVLTAASRVEARLDTLEDRQRSALTDYNNGDITARHFLRELAAVDRGARSLETAVSRLNGYNSNQPDPPIDSQRIAGIKARLIPLQGPVRNEVGRAMAGNGYRRVYIQTSSNGIVLSTIVNGDRTRYYREAYVPEHRDAAGTDKWEGNLGRAFDRLPELYPWIWGNKQGLNFPEATLNRTGVYSIRVTYPTGAPRNTLTTYLDGSTETAFYETQQLDLDTVRYRGTVENDSNGLRIQVNRTYASGPLEIRVRDNATGDPVDAAILVDGRSIGSTGGNGHRYALTPTETFTITATHEGQSVSVTADPSSSS